MTHDLDLAIGPACCRICGYAEDAGCVGGCYWVDDFIPDTERVVTVDGRTYDVHRYWGRRVLYGAFERDEDDYRQGLLTLQDVNFAEHERESDRKRYLRGHRAIRLAFPEAAVGEQHLARIQAYEETVVDVVRRQIARERGCPAELVTDDDVFGTLVTEARESAANWRDVVLEDSLGGLGVVTASGCRLTTAFPTAPLVVEFETPESSSVARVKRTSLGGGVLTAFTVTGVLDIEQPPSCALCVDTETGYGGLNAGQHVDDWNGRRVRVTVELLEGR